MAFLWLIIAATAVMLTMDAGCYLWLRANNARRASPVGALAGRRRLRTRWA